MPAAIQTVAIIGFGEAGGILAADLVKQGVGVSVFDILLDSRKYHRKMLAKARACGARAAGSLKECLAGAQLVISAVTASSDLEVARAAARSLRSGQIFLDINSVSPQTKRKAAAQVGRGSAYYVEAAVMAAVPVKRLKVPMLLGGPHAAEAAAQLCALGMNATAVSDQIGVASAVKMCRSVMIKGIEALAVECLLAARRYGAEEAVLESLADTYPLMGWKEGLPDYLISRVAEHGRRRAAEMREVAHALREVGINPLMAQAAARRQDALVEEMTRRKLPYAGPFSWRKLADALAGKRR
jgi:3-hydroxyisobutyrate dehydrogenase-like beta-hydroxyacid dehydrogenase